MASARGREPKDQQKASDSQKAAAAHRSSFREDDRPNPSVMLRLDAPASLRALQRLVGNHAVVDMTANGPAQPSPGVSVRAVAEVGRQSRGRRHDRQRSCAAFAGGLRAACRRVQNGGQSALRRQPVAQHLSGVYREPLRQRRRRSRGGHADRPRNRPTPRFRLRHHGHRSGRKLGDLTTERRDAGRPFAPSERGPRADG